MSILNTSMDQCHWCGDAIDIDMIRVFILFRKIPQIFKSEKNQRIVNIQLEIHLKGSMCGLSYRTARYGDFWKAAA